MIISHAHRFVFIKTQKTAGTSIEVALATVAGPDAVVTPVNPPVEGHRPRNFALPGRPAADLRFRARSLATRLRQGGKPPVAYFNHMSASLVAERMGTDTFDSYLSFCVERNPWDKVVSAYAWEHPGEVDPSAFRRWVATRRPPSERNYLAAQSLPVDFHRYSFDGEEVAVDLVCRYEDLAAELAAALERVDLVMPAMGSAKVGTRAPTPIADLYDEESSAIVSAAFSREIALLGYEAPA